VVCVRLQVIAYLADISARLNHPAGLVPITVEIESCNHDETRVRRHLFQRRVARIALESSAADLVDISTRVINGHN